MHPLTLFLMKSAHGYDGGVMSSGLRSSAQFVVDMLLAEGQRARLEEAVDGNSIDRIVTGLRPARAVLEAIWVTPEKMAELKKLHPGVKWTVRIHSEIPFLANEGVAVEWIAEYLRMGIEVAFNSAQTRADFEVVGAGAYLPNYYPLRKPRARMPSDAGTVNVGCFGAVRPLKNQLMQAFAAARYAAQHSKKLRFHLNGTRIEQSGANNLKNIEALLAATGGELVRHPWLVHEDFLELIAQMDFVLQVSLSESFCIVASDAVSMGVPLVGSDQIGWLPRRSRAKVDSAASIVEAMERADATTAWMNHEALEDYLEAAVGEWLGWVNG